MVTEQALAMAAVTFATLSSAAGHEPQTPGSRKKNKDKKEMKSSAADIAQLAE